MQNKQRGFIGIIIYTFAAVIESREEEIAAQKVNDFYIGWLVTCPRSSLSQFSTHLYEFISDVT